MNKIYPLIAAISLIACAVLWFGRDSLREFANDRLTADMFVSADTDNFEPGPALASNFPGVHARYRSRVVRDLRAFAGPRGTVLVALRSLDWCPYCRRQMIDLAAQHKAFEEAGIGLVAISYDSPEQLQTFSEQFDIHVPLLSDIDALSFKTLGILNADYQHGDQHYGIPYPGMIIISPGGKVVGKLFVEDYSLRVEAQAALAFADRKLDLPQSRYSF